MIVEYAQILSTAHRMLDGIEYIGKSKTGRNVRRYKMGNPNLDKVVYQAVHYHHPSVVWARETKKQYMWLYSLFVELGKEYTHRYGKVHATDKKLRKALERLPDNIPVKKMTPFRLAMKSNPECMFEDPIKSYRAFYKTKEARFSMVWTKREVPTWFAYK